MDLPRRWRCGWGWRRRSRWRPGRPVQWEPACSSWRYPGFMTSQWDEWCQDASDELLQWADTEGMRSSYGHQRPFIQPGQVPRGCHRRRWANGSPRCHLDGGPTSTHANHPQHVVNFSPTAVFWWTLVCHEAAPINEQKDIRVFILIHGQVPT